MFRKYFNQMRLPFQKAARHLVFRSKPVDPTHLYRPFRGRGAPCSVTSRNRDGAALPAAPRVMARVAGGKIFVPEGVDTAKLTEVQNRIQMALWGRGNGSGDPHL